MQSRSVLHDYVNERDECNECNECNQFRTLKAKKKGEIIY